MNSYIRMAWDELPQRWTRAEIDMLVELDRRGLNRAEIADALAEAGFPPRDETNVDHKLRRVA